MDAIIDALAKSHNTNGIEPTIRLIAACCATYVDAIGGNAVKMKALNLAYSDIYAILLAHADVAFHGDIDLDPHSELPN